MGDGATIRVRMHGNPDGPRIILGNGNGFAADGYFPFWSLFRTSLTWRYLIFVITGKTRPQFQACQRITMPK